MAGNVLDDLTTRLKSFGDVLESGFTNTVSFTNKIVKPRTDFQRPSPSVSPEPRISTRVHRDREAAAARAELILQQLYSGYYSETFDPVEYELSQMQDDSKQDDIDAMVERLTAAVEVVSVKLAKHVVKNHDKLIAGISNVTSVEDDLQAAYTIVSGARSQLRTAAEDVQQQIQVVSATRKKQRYMTVLEAASKIRRAKELPALLKKQLELNEFAEAIMLCVDCFHAVETLSTYKVMPELRTTVQRQYYETLQRLDVVLQTVCNSFSAEGYSKLLEAYLLQGITGAALADKVRSSFQDSLKDTAGRMVRALLLSKADAMSVSAASASRESSYADLCAALPKDLVKTCLQRLMDVAFELISSYNFMQQWHAAAVAKAQAASESAASSSSEEQQQQGPGAAAAPQQQQLTQVQEATRLLLEAVLQELQRGRLALWEVAAGVVLELLRVPGACQGPDFLQVVDWCSCFGSIGETFLGSPHPSRAQLLELCGGHLEVYHRSNMDALRMCLATEHWQNVAASSSDGASISGGLEAALKASPYVLPAAGQPGAPQDLGAWMEAGNPFKKGGTGRRPVSPSPAPAAAAAGSGSPTPGGGAGASTSGSASPEPSSSGRGRGLPMATVSSQQVLKWLASYAGLLRALPGRRQQLWDHTTELFDNYLLACFILFSGVGLEALVWQEDLLPHRLRSALLRITTREGCKYKPLVEELERTKPAKPTLAASSFLDFGGPSTTSAAASGFSAFKKFKNTMVDLINTDLSQPLPNSSGHHSPSPTSGFPGAQQQPRRTGEGASPQQGGRSPTPVGPQTPSQQQQQPGLSDAAGVAAAAAAMVADEYSAANAAVALKERIVAIESLMGIAQEMKGVRGVLAAELSTPAPSSSGRAQGSSSSSSSVSAREVESYYTRTIDASQDLKDAIFKGAARGWMQEVLDREHGVAACIASSNYAVKEPASRYQPWAEALARGYTTFQQRLAASGLPADIQKQMWDHAVRLGVDAMLEGLGRVRHCSVEGRAGMSLDLGLVEKALRPLAPPLALSSLRLVDSYIKAFYLPWEELGRWAQVHVAEYGKEKIQTLVEVIAEAYGIKRAVKNALMEKLVADLAEFA